MKKQAFTLIYRHGNTFRTENPMCLETVFIFMVPMISITDMFSVWRLCLLVGTGG